MGSQIDKISTRLAESPNVTAEDTWSDGDEEGEIAHAVVAAGSGAIASGTSLTLIDVQAAITKGCDCLKFDHMSAPLPPTSGVSISVRVPCSTREM